MIRQSIPNAVIVALFMLFPQISVAETIIISQTKQAEWAAVGRVNKGGFDTLSTCTGTLVAPDLVLTAAHCVPRNDPTPEQLADYTFVAGWNRGEYAAAVPFAQVMRHPDNFPQDLTMGNVHTDVALVRLAEAIPPDIVTPLLLGRVPDVDVPLAFIGYRNARKHAPELVTGCPQVHPREHLVAIGCPVFSGHSGSPLLDITPLGPSVVGVITAKVGPGAIAVRFQDWMMPYLTLP